MHFGRNAPATFNRRWGLILTLVLGGCGGSNVISNQAGPAVASVPPEITHIVIIVQENRSFDSLFSGYPDSRVNTATSGLTHTGTVVPLKAIGLEDGIDLNHAMSGFVAEYDNGKMDGFDQTDYFYPANLVGQPAGTYPYAHVRQSEVQPYWDMASSYTLADNMFPTEFSGSFTAHQDLIAGAASLSPILSFVDFPSSPPWGCDAPSGTTTPTISSTDVYTVAGPPPCVNYPTIASTLDKAHVSWKYYAPYVQAPSGTTQDLGGWIWSAFDAISGVRYGPDWANVSSPETNVLRDIANDQLPNVSWVIPDFANSDHPQAGSNTGPAWVSSIVNAIGTSPYWRNTAIIITWDDWGGWYDHVPPPQLDYTGLGIRVPMIIVSPYARRNYVSHTQYEFGSIVRFVEQTFKLPSLGTTDARANSIVDCFNSGQLPTSFTVVRAPFTARRFLDEKPSGHVVDDE